MSNEMQRAQNAQKGAVILLGMVAVSFVIAALALGHENTSGAVVAIAVLVAGVALATYLPRWLPAAPTADVIQSALDEKAAARHQERSHAIAAQTGTLRIWAFAIATTAMALALPMLIAGAFVEQKAYRGYLLPDVELTSIVANHSVSAEESEQSDGDPVELPPLFDGPLAPFEPRVVRPDHARALERNAAEVAAAITRVRNLVQDVDSKPAAAAAAGKLAEEASQLRKMGVVEEVVAPLDTAVGQLRDAATAEDATQSIAAARQSVESFLEKALRFLSRLLEFLSKLMELLKLAPSIGEALGTGSAAVASAADGHVLVLSPMNSLERGRPSRGSPPGDRRGLDGSGPGGVAGGRDGATGTDKSDQKLGSSDSSKTPEPIGRGR